MLKNKTEIEIINKKQKEIEIIMKKHDEKIKNVILSAISKKKKSIIYTKMITPMNFEIGFFPADLTTKIEVYFYNIKNILNEIVIEFGYPSYEEMIEQINFKLSCFDQIVFSRLKNSIIIIEDCNNEYKKEELIKKISNDNEIIFINR